jgi:hypothetical protein
MRSSRLLWLAILPVLAVSGCQCGPNDASINGDGRDAGANGKLPDGGVSTVTGSDGGSTSQKPPEQPSVDGGEAPTCAATGGQATLAKRPVDIIFVIDNSCSMTDEILSIERNINVNFAQQIASAGLDYRVVMLARHGTASPGESICIQQPLSGNVSCSPPPSEPENSDRFFHFSEEVGSTDSYSVILDTLFAPDEYFHAPNGWSEWLRTEATKVFVEITDDNANPRLPHDDFDRALLRAAPEHFGTARDRNYVFHTIGGFAEKSVPDQAWTPDEPMIDGMCTSSGPEGAVNNSSEHQKLSIMTGGLRFPICQHASFDTVFRKVAEGVVKGAALPCEFTIPPAPQGQTLDYGKIAVKYRPGGTGEAQTLRHVSNQSQCAPGAFYVDVGAKRVRLCPQACAAIEADQAAKIDVLFTCEVTLN